MDLQPHLLPQGTSFSPQSPSVKGILVRFFFVSAAVAPVRSEFLLPDKICDQVSDAIVRRPVSILRYPILTKRVV